MPNMKAAALDLAACGWPVFPCNPDNVNGRKGKEPLIRAGFKGATTDPVQVAEWWDRWPNALIGMVPGRAGLLIVDLDPDDHEAPIEVQHRLEELIGEALPAVPRVSTQSGGWHLYFAKPDGMTIGNGKPLPDVDIRCDNGYVIVPPSRMANGNEYLWDQPFDGAFVDAPAALIELITRPAAPPADVDNSAPRFVRPAINSEDPGEVAVRRYARAALDRAAGDMATTAAGGRGSALNATAFSMGHFVAAGVLSEREVVAALQDAADASGLTKEDGAKERDAKIMRGLSAGARAPGDIPQRMQRIADEARQKARLRQRDREGSEPAGFDEFQQRFAGADEGANDPEPDPTPPDGGGERGSEKGDRDATLRLCAEEPETDIGNGRRLLHRYRDTLLNVANRGVHVFDGRRWAWDETDSLARRLCHQTAELIAAERSVMQRFEVEQRIIAEAESSAAELKGLRALKAADLTAEQKSRMAVLQGYEIAAGEAMKALSDRKAARARHAKSSASSAKVDNMLREAAPYITKMMSDLDQDRMALNCLNGTVRFFDTPAGNGKVIWDVRLDPHRREDFITKCCAANFDINAPAPQFEAFIERMQPSGETRAFVQRFLGYCLTGLTHEQSFAFMYGGGRNGKSTLVDIVCRIIADYSATVPIETLAGEQRRKGGDATPDLMRVPGARLVRASEPEQGVKFKEAMIKSLTSDEPILIRALHRDFIEVYPDFKLVVSGNHKPRIDNDDDGIWRRVHLVPWPVKLLPVQVDKQLGRKLWLERDGILAWLIRGALSYLERGLDPPPEVTAATEEYRAESNPIGACLASCFEFTGDDQDRLDPGEIFNVYDRVRPRQGWPLFSATTFNKRLPEQAEARGATKIKSMGISVYTGIRISEAGRELMRSAALDPHTPSTGTDD